MLLLTEHAIRDHAARTDGSSALSIEGFDPQLVHPTFYYFRLGRHYRIRGDQSDAWTAHRLTDAEPELTLPPHSYAIVKSMERFKLSARVLALFGEISELAEKGLLLGHSPFIDPLFEGHLDLGLHNTTATAVRISMGQPVGKIMFFGLTEAAPPPAANMALVAPKLEARREFRDEDPVPPYDGYGPPSGYDWRKS